MADLNKREALAGYRGRCNDENYGQDKIFPTTDLPRVSLGTGPFTDQLGVLTWGPLAEKPVEHSCRGLLVMSRILSDYSLDERRH